MTDRTRSLDSIPYDVFYQIASKLDCYDFISLSRVNRSLNHAMSSEPIARKTIKVSRHLLYYSNSFSSNVTTE